MAYYEPDTKGNLVPMKGDIPDEAIRAIERYDDETIVRGMTQGMAAEAYIYRYTIQTNQGPKEIIGISTEGSYELAKSEGNIEVQNNPKFDKDSDPDYIYATISVKNPERNVTLLGFGRSCKWMIGAGNKPIQGRLDEHAFVKAGSKAQRNGILHHVSEETIIRLINEFSKRGKQARIGPPPSVNAEDKRIPAPAKQATPITPAPKPAAAAPAPAPAVKNEDVAKAIAAQVERLTALRTQVYNRFSTELKADEATMRALLKQRFQTEQLTDLNQEQLIATMTLIDDIVAKQNAPAESAAPAPAATPATPNEKAAALGFTDVADQNLQRRSLYDLLTKQDTLAMTTDEAKKFIADKGYNNTGEIDKTTLLVVIQEVMAMVEAKHNPPADESQSTPLI